MVSTRRAVASRVGASVVDGRKMRAAADDCGQPRAIVKIICKISQSLSQSNFACTYRTGTEDHHKNYVYCVNIVWPY